MTITNAQYTATGSIKATINGQELTIPDDMNNRHRKMLEGVTIAAYQAPKPTAQDVNLERDSRLESGAVVSVTGYGDVAVQGRERDVSVYTNLAFRAAQNLQLGDTTPFQFRDRDDVMHELTPTQMMELMDKAGLAAQAIYAAAWSLKDGAEIPEDYTNDKYWP